MADEPTVVNVDGDEPDPQTPPTEPDPQATTVPAPAATDPPADDLSDPEILKDEGKVKGLLAELGRTRGELRAAKQTAQQLEAYRQQVEPYMQFLQAHPELLQPKQPEPAPAATNDDPEAEEAARLLDFWKADGKGGVVPDIDKGRKHLDLVRRQAAKIAETATQPLHQQSLQARANQHYAQLLSLKHPDGTPVRKETVDAIWRRAAAEPNGLSALADPNSLAALGLMVIGADGMTRQPGVPKPPPALVTEASGGGPRPPTAMTELEKRVAQRAGIAAKDWQEHTKNYQPGRTTVLED